MKVQLEVPGDGVWEMEFKDDSGPWPQWYTHNGFHAVPNDKIRAELSRLAWDACYAGSTEDE